MGELIDREAAIDAIVSVTAFFDADYIKNLCQNPANSEDWLGGVCDAINAIEDVTAVDAAPVAHGYWRIDEYDFFTCSACGGSYYNGADSTNQARHMLEQGETFNFCPNCGARMDA